MQVIHKHTIRYPNGWNYDDIRLPTDYTVLDVQDQNGVMVMWVQHSVITDDTPMVKRRFITVGTGVQFIETAVKRYIGSVQDRSFVWHVFEGSLVDDPEAG